MVIPSFGIWQDMLNKTAPMVNKQPHSILCWVSLDNKPYEIRVLTPNEYAHFYDNHSRWSNSCRKLSLTEIVEISRKYFTNIKINYKETLLSKFKTVVSTTNVFEKKSFENFIQELNDLDLLQAADIALAIKKMYTRSYNHHVEQKVSSIWGKIKWVIWVRFYDQKDKVHAIEEMSKINVSGLIDEMIEEIKKRLLIEMREFEKLAVPVDRVYYNFDSQEAKEIFSWSGPFMRHRRFNMEPVNIEANVAAKWGTKDPIIFYRRIEAATNHRNNIMPLIHSWINLGLIKNTSNSEKPKTSRFENNG